MKHCTIPDCDRPHRSLDMCEMHYLRARRAQAAQKRAATLQAETLYRLDELEHLLDGDVWPPSAASRCGWTISGAMSGARREGRVDLANLLRAFKELEGLVAA